MDDNRLLRAARVVAAANLLYLGYAHHHHTCASERGPEEDCDCGADNFNEAMGILTRAVKDQPWNPTPKELEAAIDALLEEEQS